MYGFRAVLAALRFRGLELDGGNESTPSSTDSEFCWNGCVPSNDAMGYCRCRGDMLSPRAVVEVVSSENDVVAEFGIDEGS